MTMTLRERRSCQRLPMCLTVAASLLLVLCAFPAPAQSFDPLDPTGNITIVWDIMSWTGDGYIADVTMYNYQQFRQVKAPGWALNWTWTAAEVIWNMQGAFTTEAGNCSRYATPGGTLPYCCAVTPTIKDLPPTYLNTYQGSVAGCCKSGEIPALVPDPSSSYSKFQLQVGNASSSIDSVVTPQNFTLLIDGYTCTAPVATFATEFGDATTHTTAIATWHITCIYTAKSAKPAHKCCVSLTSFYSSKVIPCATCACACGNYTAKSNICNVTGGDTKPWLWSDGLTNLYNEPTARLCSPDGCPVSIHYHLKENYYDYWRAKITITNRDLYQNWSNWNLVVEHPNFANFTEAFSFNASQITPFDQNTTAIFWGLPEYNSILLDAGNTGNVQSELLFAKIPEFTLDHGWGFPRRIYFNGEECVMPSTFPPLPSAAHRSVALPLSISLGGFVLATIVGVLLSVF
eukprot:TRINITY_DN35681_c0_g1_i1.p1 TRINITY_DN35681_c0_g1~~TRINITY_DN35681_c0_g1_i1.p1  ORF type:complete len:460 (-),score=51.62 TRINITY_DN35681_c0_g1_i1:1375-2754(-)